MQAASWWNRIHVIAHQCSFLLTGVYVTLATQWLFYIGAATPDSALAQLSQYAGMLLIGCIVPILARNQKIQYSRLHGDQSPVQTGIGLDMIELAPPASPKAISPTPTEGPMPHTAVMRLALLDIVAGTFIAVGFSLIGSGMYQVIYSSVVVWCALLTFVFMGRSLVKWQWLAIVGTSVGLMLSSLGQEQSLGHTASSLVFGTLMTFCGTFLYACLYVYSDHVLSSRSPPPLPARVCFYTGIYATVICLAWIAIYTLPRLHTLIRIDPTVPVPTIVIHYILIIISNGIHSWNYYELVHRTGNVATGILQGLRAVFVYALSHVLFCKTDEAQCFTIYKGCGSTLVIGCVVLFIMMDR